MLIGVGVRVGVGVRNLIMPESMLVMLITFDATAMMSVKPKSAPVGLMSLSSKLSPPA